MTSWIQKTTSGITYWSSWHLDGTVLRAGRLLRHKKCCRDFSMSQLQPRIQRKTVDERPKSSLFWSSLGCLSTLRFLELAQRDVSRGVIASCHSPAGYLWASTSGCDTQLQATHRTCCDLQWDAMGESTSDGNSPKIIRFCWRNHPLGAKHLWIPSFRSAPHPLFMYSAPELLKVATEGWWWLVMHDGW